MISAIIPVYNRERLIQEALQSVADQSVLHSGGGEQVEIIVVDDGSTDGTREAVRELAGEVVAAGDTAAAGASAAAGTGSASAGDLTIRLRALSHSGFPGLVRNSGVAWARGNLLAFLDADDLWEPEKLARQLLLHRSLGYEVSHTRERWERKGRLVSQKRHKHRRRGFVFDESLVKCILGPSTLMMARNTFERSGGFREDLEIAEDFEYFLRLTDHIPVGYVDEALTVKRAGWGDQLSEKYGRIEPFRLDALKRLVDSGYWRGREALAAAARRELARKCGIHASGARKRGREAEARRYEELAREYRENG